MDEGKNLAKPGTFEFSIAAAFDDPNRYVVGVAREQVGGQLSPVAVADLKSSADYVFTPKPKLYVTSTTAERGQIFDLPDNADQYAEIDYKDGRKTAMVSETGGKFTVTYL